MKTWNVILSVWLVFVGVPKGQSHCVDVMRKLEELDSLFRDLQQSVQSQAFELRLVTSKAAEALQMMQEIATSEVLNSLVQAEAHSEFGTQAGTSSSGGTQAGASSNGGTQTEASRNTQVEEGLSSEEEGNKEEASGSGDFDDEDMGNEISGYSSGDDWDEAESSGMGPSDRPNLVQFLTPREPSTQIETDEFSTPKEPSTQIETIIEDHTANPTRNPETEVEIEEH